MAVKPYYEDASVTLYCGDCREIAPGLDADAIVTDPPYGISYLHSAGGLGLHSGRLLERIAGDDTPFDPLPWLAFRDTLLFGADHFARRLPEDRGCWIAWDKAANGGPADSFSDAEFLWCSRRVSRNVLRVQWKGIANHKADDPLPRLHPSQKPLKLMRACVALFPDADCILDPFAGSGVTLLAAKLDGRRAIGIEIEERYCEIAAKWLAQGVLFGAPCPS